MPSPFPGMDPFLEGNEWEDFHTTFITTIRESLSSSLGADYVVRVERRVYVEYADGEQPSTLSRQADVAILAQDSSIASGIETSQEGVPTATECLLPMPTEHREAYLVIRHHESMEVVTVIEVLSPANKRPGAGRREYLNKRQQLISSQSHLVEIDLLRGGESPPVVGELPPGEYHAIVSRADRRPTCNVYSWMLSQQLPKLPIPLKQGDDDVAVDLQEVFTTVYDRARYNLSIDYRTEPTPPLTPEQRGLLS